MTFSSFAKKLKPSLSRVSSQGRFVGQIFHAAGSTYFPEEPAYGEDSYQVKLFGGKKPFNSTLKSSFPIPINKDGLRIYLDSRIGMTSVKKLINDFGIPVNAEENKDFLIEAICLQFENIVTDASDEVDDVVSQIYLALLAGNKVEPKQYPFYPGDDYIVLGNNPARCPDVGFYKEFTHTWTIKNSGAVNWSGRYLEIINQHEVKPIAKTPKVEIPITNPGNEATITVAFDSRGDERGLNETVWQIKDSNGQLCFPNKEGLRLLIKVYNDLDE